MCVWCVCVRFVCVCVCVCVEREREREKDRMARTGDRPYLCTHPGCGRDFVEPGNLNRYVWEFRV